jgi:hypothetical protein
MWTTVGASVYILGIDDVNMKGYCR